MKCWAMPPSVSVMMSWARTGRRVLALTRRRRGETWVGRAGVHQAGQVARITNLILAAQASAISSSKFLAVAKPLAAPGRKILATSVSTNAARTLRARSWLRWRRRCVVRCVR